MAAGRPPFRAAGTLAVLKRVAEDTPRPIREVIPETPKWLCVIIDKLHAKKPEDRFQSAREVADILADCESPAQGERQAQGIFRGSPKANPLLGDRDCGNGSSRHWLSSPVWACGSVAKGCFSLATKASWKFFRKKV